MNPSAPLTKAFPYAYVHVYMLSLHVYIYRRVTSIRGIPEIVVFFQKQRMRVL